MDFEGRYKILEMLSDGEARTFKALQTSSGRTVLLHQLWAERTPPNQPDLASLVFAFLQHATAEEMKILIDMGEEKSRVFVVTQDLPVCQDLRQWLQAAAKTPGAAGKASVPKSAPRGDSGATGASGRLPSQAGQESSVPPDTTQLFTTPKVIAGQTSSPSAEKRSSAPTAPPKVPLEPRTLAGPKELAGHPVGLSEAEVLKTLKPPVASPPPSKAKDDSSEFNRMFFGSPGPSRDHSVAETSPPEKPSAPPASKAERPSQSQRPAGFEVVFESRKQQSRGPAPPAVEKPLPPPPPAPGPAKEAPGDFTRIFYGVDASKAMPASPVPAAEKTRLTPLAPDRPAQPKGPGEFTRLFQAQYVEEKPPAAPSVEAERGQPLAPPVQQSPASPPAAVTPKGPGEFTLLFRPGPQATRSEGTPIPASSPKPTGPFSSPLSQQGAGELTQLIQGYQPGKSTPTPPVLEQSVPVAPPPPPNVDKAKPGAFTLIFQRPPEPTTPPPPAAPSPPVVQTPPAAPPAPEPDEYMRMFELPSGGASASPQGAPPAAVPQPAAGRAMPAIPMVSVSPPVAPSMPYVQPPVVPAPMVPQPQPYQIPPPQFQQPAVPPAFAMAPQPVMPQMQPMAVSVPVAPQAGPPKTGKSKFLVPLIILGGLFLIAVGLVLLFALKH